MLLDGLEAGVLPGGGDGEGVPACVGELVLKIGCPAQLGPQGDSGGDGGLKH